MSTVLVTAAFFFCNAFIRLDSAVLTPGRVPASMTACFTHPRNVSVLIPNCSRTCPQADVKLPVCGTRSRTNRIARSRNSSGNFLSAGMLHADRGYIRASINPGAVQLHQCCGLGRA